jgi:hypothetical protein
VRFFCCYVSYRLLFSSINLILEELSGWLYSNPVRCFSHCCKENTWKRQVKKGRVSRCDGHTHLSLAYGRQKQVNLCSAWCTQGVLEHLWMHSETLSQKQEELIWTPSSAVQSMKVENALWQACEVAGDTKSKDRKPRMICVVAQLTQLTFFLWVSLWLQSMERCHPHLELVFLPLSTQSRISLRNMYRALFPKWLQILLGSIGRKRERERERERETRLAGMDFWNFKAHPQWHISSNKATPSNLSNPFKQFYSLVTEHSNTWTYGSHYYSICHILVVLVVIYIYNVLLGHTGERMLGYSKHMKGSMMKEYKYDPTYSGRWALNFGLVCFTSLFFVNNTHVLVHVT